MKSKKYNESKYYYNDKQFSLCQAQEENFIKSASLLLLFFYFSIYIGLVILN